MPKKILILGIDGYIGWALANYLRSAGYQVSGLDNAFRRNNAKSLVPISKFETREIEFGSLSSSKLTDLLLEKPDAIVHLAEQPSAPWSMREARYAILTQRNNVEDTLWLLWKIKEICPETHLIKLGTMGEYGTPNCEIPEGAIPDECSEPIVQLISNFKIICPMKGLLFPRSPGSFYHASKVFDTYNIKLACDIWGLTSTDIMQGIVFGHEFGTRFDYDEYFGTVINRFCVQALAGIPLTIYGTGGQTRGYLPLLDSLKCIEIVINNPPTPGTYRTLNQFAITFSVDAIATMVIETADSLGISATKQYIPNPRVESELHLYQVAHNTLHDLGYKPNYNFEEVMFNTMQYLYRFKDDIRPEIIYPTTTWR